MAIIVNSGYYQYDTITSSFFAWCYIFNQSGDVWSPGSVAFVTYSTASLSTYKVSMTGVMANLNIDAGQAIYAYATFPTDIPAGLYDIAFGHQSDVSETLTFWGGGPKKQIWWTGSDIETVRNDVYHADIHLMFHASNDIYVVTWFKNGSIVASTVTSPTIDVVDSSNSSIISSASMTAIGSTENQKYSEPTNRIDQGAKDSYIITASATIDGATRSYSRVITNNLTSLIG